MGELELLSVERLARAMVEQQNGTRRSAAQNARVPIRQSRLGEILRAAATIVAGSLGRRRAA